MMEHMRHTGKSGKFAVICGVVAAGLLVLTAMTLAEPVFLAFLGVLGLAYLGALAEILVRRRRFALLSAGAGTALALGFSLAFVSTWELAFSGQSSFLGTPLPTDDPDNYFLGAACALAGTFGILFLGALWPGRGQTMPARRPSSARRGSPQATRPSARSGNQASAPQRASVTRSPSGGSSTAARRPSSSASPSARPAPRSGSGSASRR
ncbi:hypothetical protein OUO20_00175 [Arthrobacter sp. FX8]|nr:hypothetical protein [Arthrobacter sp. FX8]WAJ33530.1 hypothetical protein OUO20_00175 [Arthrobacter sp. FX8]